jgi:hypothetical protein
MLVGCFYHDGDHGDRHEAPSDEEPGPSGRPPQSQADFCQDWADAACSSAVISACQASNADECEQTQADFCRSLVPSDISTSGADECLAAVTSAYRDADLRGDELKVVLRLGGPCARVVKGKSASGESCDASSDCDVSRGYACVKKSDSSSGTCQVPKVVEPGRDCSDPQDTCSHGFYCDGHNCIETVKSGDACTIHEQCGDDAYCDDSGHCAERLAVNDSCQDDVQCAHGICSDFDGGQVCTDHVVLSRADPICAKLR